MPDGMEVTYSMRQQIANLAVGESFSRCTRLAFDDMTRDDLVAATASLRNSVAVTTRRAKQETGNEYVVETGDFFTLNKNLILLAVVTRTD